MAPPRRFCDEDILRIRDQYASGAGIQEVADHWGVWPVSIDNILRVRTYKNVRGWIPVVRRPGRRSPALRKAA